MERVEAIRRIVPDCGLSTDIFVGYCTETEEDHQLSLQLMREVGYDSAFMFKYSERPGTYASKHLADDVPEEVKLRRLNELIELQTEISARQNSKDVGLVREVLVEGYSKRSREKLRESAAADTKLQAGETVGMSQQTGETTGTKSREDGQGGTVLQLCGRTEQNKMVVFDKGNHHIGQRVMVRITDSSSATLKGECCEAEE
jgi:tRNA-2-methylthio-N6-dimethylallyladenosine synthase